MLFTDNGWVQVRVAGVPRRPAPEHSPMASDKRALAAPSHPHRMRPRLEPHCLVAHAELRLPLRPPAHHRRGRQVCGAHHGRGVPRGAGPHHPPRQGVCVCGGGVRVCVCVCEVVVCVCLCEVLRLQACVLPCCVWCSLAAGTCAAVLLLLGAHRVPVLPHLYCLRKALQYPRT